MKNAAYGCVNNPWSGVRGQATVLVQGKGAELTVHGLRWGGGQQSMVQGEGSDNSPWHSFV